MTEWTSTPPTEPGWYWVSYLDGSPRISVCEFTGDSFYLVGSDMCFFTGAGYEQLFELKWWPIPIEEPQ